MPTFITGASGFVGLALAEHLLARGQDVVGYDLLSTAPLRLLHRNDGDHLRLMGLAELRETLAELPIDQSVLTPSLAGLVVRFTLRKSARSGP